MQEQGFHEKYVHLYKEHVMLETGEMGLVPESYVSWTGGGPISASLRASLTCLPLDKFSQ